MKCNIDARGKRARLVAGLLCVAAGAILAVLAWCGAGPFWALLGPGLGLLAAGVFQLFEARHGWCALRALGVRTPL